jgi:futalosine hydrolase
MPMKILIVAATSFEIRPFLNKLIFLEKTDDYLEHYLFGNTHLHVLIPGVGMMFTAFHLGRQLLREKYDYVINAGICGSYSHSLPLGEVVEIIEDCISELGAEDSDRFLTLFDLGLMDPDEIPYKNGKLTNSLPISSGTLEKLRKVRGITVNTVHGNKDSIERIKTLFSPSAESMEGAAFLYACLLAKIPNAQIRAVSNYVEERDRSRWNLDLALRNLNNVLIELLGDIAE